MKYNIWKAPMDDFISVKYHFEDKLNELIIAHYADKEERFNKLMGEYRYNFLYRLMKKTVDTLSSFVGCPINDTTEEAIRTTVGIVVDNAFNEDYRMVGSIPWMLSEILEGIDEKEREDKVDTSNFAKFYESIDLGTYDVTDFLMEALVTKCEKETCPSLMGFRNDVLKELRGFIEAYRERKKMKRHPELQLAQQ